MDSSDDDDTPVINLSSEHAAVMFQIPGEQVVKCNDCVYFDALPEKVFNHYLLCHKNEGFKCSSCDFWSNTFSNVSSHQKTLHSGDTHFVVEVEQISQMTEDMPMIDLDEVVDHAARLVTIIKSGPGIGMRRCLLCNHTEKERLPMTTHIFSKHLKFFPYACKTCGYKSVDYSIVKKHAKKNHHGSVSVIRRKFYGRLPDIPDADAAPLIDQQPSHQPVISSVYSIEPRQELPSGQFVAFS